MANIDIKLFDVKNNKFITISLENKNFYEILETLNNIKDSEFFKKFFKDFLENNVVDGEIRVYKPREKR